MANNWMEKEKWNVFSEFPNLLMGKNSIREVAEEGQEQFDKLRKIQSEVTRGIEDGTLISDTRKPTPIELLDHEGFFELDTVYEIKPSVAIKWAKDNGYLIDYAFLSQPFKPSTDKQHDSELLDIQKAVITEFWENHDPQRPPKDEVVIAWIKSQFPKTSDNEAKAIDLICRPYRYKSSKKHFAKY